MPMKPEVLMIGPYPVWDMEDLDARYVVHKLWEAADRDRMIEAYRGAIRAIAIRCELGASADLMKRLPALEIVSCYGVGTRSSPCEGERDPGDQYAERANC